MYNIRVGTCLSQFPAASFQQVECVVNGRNTYRLAVIMPIDGTDYKIHLQVLCRIKECSAWLRNEQCPSCRRAGRAEIYPYNRSQSRVGLPFDMTCVPPPPHHSTPLMTFGMLDSSTGNGIIQMEKILCVPQQVLPFERLAVLVKPVGQKGRFVLQAVCPNTRCGAWIGDFLEEKNANLVLPDDKRLNVWCDVCKKRYQVQHVLIGPPFDNMEPPADSVGDPVSVGSP